MSSSTEKTKRIYPNFSLSAKIEAYLKSVAKGFDRKGINPPRDIIMHMKNTPDEWIFVGFIPKRKTRLGWFMYHMIHGIAMGYPFHRVLAFSLITTKYDDKKEKSQ